MSFQNHLCVIGSLSQPSTSPAVVHRSCDIPQSHRSKRAFTKILAIIPGPAEPKSMDPYMKPILHEFRALQPGSSGIQVRDANAGEVVPHHAVLGGVYGDTPAARKLNKWLGHSSFLSCGYCLLRGDNRSGTMRFLGYAQTTACGALPPIGTDRQCFCGDSSLLLSDEQQRERAEYLQSLPHATRKQVSSQVQVAGGYVLCPSYLFLC